MMMEQIQRFKKFINDGLYYEAHEALEELWFPIRKEKNEYSFLLKGFINGAVSLELLKRNKIEQSKKIYLVYKKYVTLKRIDKVKNEIGFIELKVFMDDYIQQRFDAKNNQNSQISKFKLIQRKNP